jgi:23S rRNA (cytidine1920-2'-O)/16S rRNA (cytidine1409-2'-O)-methyltransferase
LRDILAFAQGEGYGVKGLVRSPVQGPKGNVEFLAWLGTGIPPADEEQLSAWIDAVAPLEETGQENSQ